jgi:hypothetical protein
MMENVIHIFEDNPEVGVFQCTHKPPFIPDEIKEREAAYHNYYTDHGFFFRNLKKIGTGDLLFPEDAVGNLGACEEFIIGYAVASAGYKTLYKTHSSIFHAREAASQDFYAWGKKEVMEHPRGNLTYVRNNYKEITKRV